MEVADGLCRRVGSNEVTNGTAKCLDNTGYYTGADKANVNTYGLYKRAQDGSLPSFGAGTPARKLRNAFRCKAAGVDCP